KHILATNPGARIAVLYQNDDFGKDYVDGLKEGLGDKAGTMILATASFEVSDPTIESQIVSLKAAGADTLLDAASPKFTAQAIRKVYDSGWRPAHFISQTSSSPAAVLQPAGPEKAVGVMSAAATKSVSDRQWANDPDYVAWLAFMREHFPEGDTADQLA